MIDLQQHLAARFEALQAARSESVYFVEHGLDAVELTSLWAVVREHLVQRSLEHTSWSVAPLPLLVATTEVGYQYRGPGTDFWPLLEQELGTGLTHSARGRIRDLFEAASNRYRGARPADSQWARAFHLIAWPITHALLPVEFHRPLASALTRIRESVRDLDDATLYATVRHAIRQPTARFETWLADAELVTAMVRHLLGDPAHGLSASILERIGADLSADDVARRDVATARRVQKSVAPRQAESTRIDLPSVDGVLLLRRVGAKLLLMGQIPRFDAGVEPAIRRDLRVRRYAPQLWGVSSRVPSEQLLSGVPFTIDLPRAPEAGTPLLPDLESLLVSDEHKDLLRSISLDLAPPLIFARNSEGDIANQVSGVELSVARPYWLLVSPGAAADFKGFPRIGEVGPYVAVELDPVETSAADELKRLGYRISRNVSVALVGAPPLELTARVPCFQVGDPLFVVPQVGASGEMLVDSEGQEVVVKDAAVKIVVQPGEHRLVVFMDGAKGYREFRFRGEQQRQVNRPQICWVDLQAPELTVEALLSRKISLRVEALVPLEGLELTLQLSAARRTVSVSTPLQTLPQTIAGTEEVWARLLEDDVVPLVHSDPRPTLQISVGTLITRSFDLDRRVRSCWWERSSNQIILRSELGDIEFGTVGASDPAANPAAIPPEAWDDAVLHAPIGIDAATFGPSALFSTLCVAPKRLSLSPPRAKVPLLRRGRMGAKMGELGLEPLLEAYLRWAVAESTSPVAELRRRQTTTLLERWASELTCGPEWAQREQELRSASSDPWQCLAVGLGQRSLGDSLRVPMTEPGVLAQAIVSEIRRTIPDLWMRIGPRGDVAPADIEVLQQVSRRTHTLARTPGDLSPEREFAYESELLAIPWAELVVQARGRAELHPLADMLIPSGSAELLVGVDYTLLAPEELLDEFVRWSNDARAALLGGAPERSILEAALLLWMAPERAIYIDWRGAVDSLVADRSIARASRYIALRVRDFVETDSA